MFDPVQIDKSVKKRDSRWVQVCPNCQNERYISYCQAYNIKKSISNKECKHCLIELKKYIINTNGLSKGRKYNNGTLGKKFKNKGTYYKNILNNPTNNPLTIDKMRKAKIGKYGEFANNWQGGKTRFRLRAMSTLKYKKWRSFVLERDNYTCTDCNSTSNLHVHHIKYWSTHPELRYDVDNGVVLCKECHYKVHRKDSKNGF